MSKKSCFRGHFGGRLGEREEALLKSGLHQLYHSYWSLWRQLGCKKSLLLIWKDLTLFLNGLTTHEWYSRCNGDNLRGPNHMHLSPKQETFSRSFFLNFWNLHESLNIFQKRKTVIADVFPKLRTPKNVLQSISKKSHFKGHFSERYVELEEALLKSGRHHL